ncbi:MAG: efflux RND transporter periplasmic adaptor subunit [Candidatus Hydrogenedentes bacterium]|nr:efflux RND transporter periplasmic adaptor subunit [Candidatus Hydrogenedentota bacterium]
MTKRMLLLPVLAVVALVSGCGQPVEGSSAATKPLAERILIPVEVAAPLRMDISSYFETTTRVQAENRVEVMSKGTGQCKAVHVEEGNRVNAGDVLAELDQTELEAQARQARVTVRQQKTAFEIAERSLAEGIGAPVERDNTQFAYEQAQAMLEMHEAQLRHQVIRAPISGIVTNRILQAGMLVSPGMPAFTVVDPESYVLPISVPEKELSRLSEGQEARVRVDSIEGRELTARVRRINPSMDPLSGTVKVILDFDPADRAQLREAAFARVRLVMQTNSNTLVVPKDALIEENARTYLMVVERDEPKGEEAAEGGENAGEVFVARRIEVQKGLEDSNFIEILSGVDDNSKVVVMGQHTLKANALVTITTAAREIESRAGMSPDEALEAARRKSEEDRKRQEAAQSPS